MTVDKTPNYTIKLPSIEEQETAVACLSSIDALIEAQIQQLEDLKAHRQLLMGRIFETEPA